MSCKAMVMVLHCAADIAGVELLAAKHDRQFIIIFGKQLMDAANVPQYLYFTSISAL